MEGTSIPTASNYLKGLDPAELIEKARLIEDLVVQPGWVVLCEVATVVAQRGDTRLRKIAEDAALSVDPAVAIDYAKRYGAQSNVTFHPDVAASILESAKTAAQKLKSEAEAEQAAAGGQS